MCQVLIIDDNQSSAEIIKVIIEDAGEANVDIATNYQDALKLVKQAIQKKHPYEIFLIDQRLGKGDKDGVDVMQELRTLNPDSDAIIFTGFEDNESGMRAYEAGAFRYLSRPFRNKELLFILKSLKQWRKEQREHDWQKLFTKMTEESLRKNTFADVSEIVVQYAIKLGFSRAHLFWVPTQEDVNPDNLRVGISCAGENCIPTFPSSSNGGVLYPVKKWMDLNQAKRLNNVVFLKSSDAKKVQEQAEKIGYQWPKGEITFLPLWGSNRLLGEVMLDHDRTKRTYSAHETSLLNFFSQQVAIVLENASLVSREQRSVKETTIISQIGRQVTDSAAEQTNLTELLDKVREQVNLLRDVSNFTVVLLNPESGELEIGLLYEGGVRQMHPSSPDNLEIERFLVNRGSNIFWPQDVSKHLELNNISLHGKVPSSCVGVQLRVGKKVIGGMVAKTFENNDQFTRRDYVLFSAVTSQISGAVKLIQINEIEKRDAERLNILRRAMTEMLRIAQENEDNLWLTVLTIATANFGTGFNRGLLFLENKEHSALICKAGIGTNDPDLARQDWKNDLSRGHSFNDFLQELQEGRVRQTDFHGLVGISLSLNKENHIFSHAIQSGHPILIEENQFEKEISPKLKKRVSSSNCAILPILTGRRAIGLVLVDNKHTGQALSESMLARLQTVLSHAGLVWETLREQKKSESLLDANYQIMGEARLRSLQETLQNICKTARTITEADWAIVYPLKYGKSTSNPELDLKNFGYDGALTNTTIEEIISEKPRVGGVSTHVIRRDTLVIQDIENEDLAIGKQKLSAHHFIQKEGVKALIGVAVRETYSHEPLGILYLNYRKAREITEAEVHHAKSFASLAALAIENYRRFDENRGRALLKTALETSEIVGADLELDKILSNVLEHLQKIFPHTTLCVLLYDKNNNALKFAPITLKYYTIKNPEYKNRLSFPLDELEKGSIACKVARSSLQSRRAEKYHSPDVSRDPDYLPLNPGTNSELCVSLMQTNGELLGILALERSQSVFYEDDIALIETVAHQLSIAIERFQEKEQMIFKSNVATLTAWAADLAHDINNEVGQIRNLAYLIKASVTGNQKVQGYANAIDVSAQQLASVGPFSDRASHPVQIDQALKMFLEELTRDRGLELELYLNIPNVSVRANPQELKRVLRHLVRNSARAMKEMAEKKIQVTTRRHQTELATVEIIFKDFGPGVDESVQGHLFQSQTTTKERGGSGLILTRQLIEDMGGTIRLVSPNTETGAVFSILLPVMDVDPVSDLD